MYHKKSAVTQLVECNYWEQKGRLFETHWRYCGVSLNRTFYSLLSTGLTQEDRKKSQHDWKFVDWELEKYSIYICKHKQSIYGVSIV